MENKDMRSAADFIVQDHMEGEYDNSYLHIPLFDVNMRLYRTSQPYKNIVSNIIEYMKSISDMEFSDYGELKGLSGANIGIPFNIVMVTYDEDLLIMINPIVTKTSPSKTTRKSNCGSLRLPKSIEVSRYDTVHVSFFDADGKEQVMSFSGPTGSTVQHEIDHNNGVTIEDRAKEV